MDIDEAICIDVLWLNMGAERAVYEADPHFAHISKLIPDL